MSLFFSISHAFLGQSLRATIVANPINLSLCGLARTVADKLFERCGVVRNASCAKSVTNGLGLEPGKLHPAIGRRADVSPAKHLSNTYPIVRRSPFTQVTVADR